MAKDARITASFDELLEIAEDLQRNGRRGAGVDHLLADLNAKTRGAFDAPTFLALYDLDGNSSTTTLLEHLLALRRVAPFPRSGSLDAWASALDRHRALEGAEGESIVWQAYRRYLANELHSLSKIGLFLSVELVVSNHSAASLAAFAAEYVPPANRQELLELARRWIVDADAKRETVYAAIGEKLFLEGWRVLWLTEFEKTAEYLRAGVASRHDIALGSLRTMLALPPPEARSRVAKPPQQEGAGHEGIENPRGATTDEADAPPPTRYATHKKFGRGRIVAESGDVVTVDFDGGERRLQRSFLTME